MIANRSVTSYLEVGCRIPKDYFWAIGWGDSDVGIETGSYDAALDMAGIENYNGCCIPRFCHPRPASFNICRIFITVRCWRVSLPFSTPINQERALPRAYS